MGDNDKDIAGTEFDEIQKCSQELSSRSTKQVNEISKNCEPSHWIVQDISAIALRSRRALVPMKIWNPARVWQFNWRDRLPTIH